MLASSNAYLRALLQLARADGSLDLEEKQFISAVAERRGLGEVDFESMENAEVQDIPENPLERFALLDDMMRLAAVDGHLDDGEQRMISELATKLGFEEGLVSSMLDSLKSSLEAPFVNAYRPGGRPTNFLNG